MSLQVATHQTEGYQVFTEVYEGPLDLLLELIEKAELDITRLALAKVTDQYLAYMQMLQERNAAEVSAFLVIAARLLQIKSAALLPRPSLAIASGEEEDPGEALARQLILYKRFKELAGSLLEREQAGKRTYLRVAPPPRVTANARLDLSGITLIELVDAARSILFPKSSLTSLDKVVNMPRITIREKIQTILDTLRHFPNYSFRQLLNPKLTRVEIVVTFLALLELVKRHIVSAQQTTIFGDIQLEQLENLDSQEPIQIEFEDDQGAAIE